jgi:4-hydroxyphenylacetate 3-monooxygenase
MSAETAGRTRPFTGAEYLESIRDGREIYIYGERVKDVTTHPAFATPARMLARLYDALHDPAKAEGADHARPIPAPAASRTSSTRPRGTPKSSSARATRSPNGRASPTGGLDAAPITRPAFLATLGANASVLRAVRRERAAAGTSASTTRCPSSTTPSSTRRSTATSRSTK